MSVLTDPATYGILNSELTNCPRTAAVLGAVPSQSLANAVENMTRTESTAGRLRVKDGERLYLESLHARSLRGWDISIRHMRLES